jgi:hypothetical protein
MSWQGKLNGHALSWLLEDNEPNARYLALRDLLDRPSDDPELLGAREQAHRQGPIPTILNEMNPQGYWVKATPGYGPKYYSAVWSLIMLGQLGASMALDPRIERAIQYLCEHALTEHGQFSYNGAPGGTFDCLQGNLCAALLDLGFADPRLDKAFEWMARTVTGEGIAPQGDKTTPLRYYAYKCGPNFACGANDKLPCAWGAVKVMGAFGRLPAHKQTPLIQDAIRQGAEFLLGVDPASAAYPTVGNIKPNASWWKFGFPVFYISDILQNVEALVRCGYSQDPRLASALALIASKQDARGRWALEYSYASKTWGQFGRKGQPNKWVTLRAAWVLKNAAEQEPSSAL